MIIMINGAFGAGKTSAAAALQPKIANSMVYDPEEIGYMLRKLLPEEHRKEQERTDDFQDIELWRVLTVKIAREVKQKYNKHLIIPMTIYKKENFDYIYSGLKEMDQDLHHFCLTASLDKIFERLAKRGDQFGGWQYQQAPKCVEAFKADVFETRICTDQLETGDVIDIILEKVEG